MGAEDPLAALVCPGDRGSRMMRLVVDGAESSRDTREAAAAASD